MSELVSSIAISQQGFHPDSPTIAAVQAAVCVAFNVLPIDMISQRRGREVARPRQIAMYLARQLTPYSLPVIGRHFGNRDHTTVIHAIRTVERIIGDNPEFSAKVTTLQSAIISTEDRAKGKLPTFELAREDA